MTQSPTINRLDHMVLTVADIARTRTFYEDVMGMQGTTFDAADGSTRHALHFGDAKINLHPQERPFEPKARRPTPGSADLCFVTHDPLEDWQRHLADHGIALEMGPVARSGATGPLMSLYIRDPDGNLIEIGRSDQPA